jgi:hypothetical protein
VRPTPDVMAFCRAEHESPTQDWEGYCLRFTRLAFDRGPFYLSASDAWRGADHKHLTEDGLKVPRGTPVFWLGGSKGYGHVAVSAGKGLCWSTDWGGAGQVNLARINDITKQWRLDLVGWTEDLNGGLVWVPPVAQDTPRIDQIVELARAAKRATGNAKKDADMQRIIDLAKPWSAKY